MTINITAVIAITAAFAGAWYVSVWLYRMALQKMARDSAPEWVVDVNELHWEMQELDNERPVTNAVAKRIVDARMQKLIHSQHKGVLLTAVFTFHRRQHKFSAVLGVKDIQTMPVHADQVLIDVLLNAGYYKVVVQEAKFIISTEE